MSDIAVIGLSCRVPGASGAEKFWQNLRDGVDSISHFREDELETREPPALGTGHYVRARSVLEGADLFDAAFFGILPSEARLMDPQHRVFLECCWAAIENAGYDPSSDSSTTGVFAGCSTNTYLLRHIAEQRPGFLLDYTDTYQVGEYATLLGSNADMLATRVAYKLNLKGPAFTVQCGCSTSLVAVCQAVKSLQTYECDMALAGGVSITFPQKRGYMYEPGGMVSPDGRCRAFDVDAQGTVFGHGVGVVVLKRLEDAVDDGDDIAAVIKGTALNNDGAVKVGFTAPGAEGQAQVIAMAQASAGVSPDSIGYVEAHGTGTPLGDPIEFAALVEAFRDGTDKTGYCALGTAKTNIGHLDVASGVIGLIKTILSLQHRQIPPLLNYQRPNPHIDLASSPFFIAKVLKDWPAPEGAPRRAGVSAFGVGGTNAHVVIEEAPVPVSRESHRSGQVLCLSARSPAALSKAKANLANYFADHPDVNLADVAYTLNTGRHSFDHRWSSVAHDVSHAVDTLNQQPSAVTRTLQKGSGVSFLIAGQGSQSVNMARGLFCTEPVFRRSIERCAEILQPHLKLNLVDMLYPASENLEAASVLLEDTILAQPAVFSVAFSVAQLWASWGIRPTSMIGHSVGELVAACLAGVMSLEDALGLVAARGTLMSALPGGAMLCVQLPETDLRNYLTDDLSLAALNAPSLTVIAGPHDAIDALDKRLQGHGVATRPLHTSHAFHSAMMEPVVAPFAECVAAVDLHPPVIPFVSTVTGTWITAAEATDPLYWATHLRLPVRFSDAVQTVLSVPGIPLLDLGPGTTMQTLVRRHATTNDCDRLIVSSLTTVSSEGDEDATFRALGLLWESGLQPDWQGFYQDERRLRVSLPSYPFERTRHWIDLQREERSVAGTTMEDSVTSSDVSEQVDSVVEQWGSRPEADEVTEHQEVQDRMPRIVAQLVDILQTLSGLDVEQILVNTSFLELGFDSLFLTQFSQSLFSAVGLKVTFGQLLSELSSIQALAHYLDMQLPADPRVEAHPGAAVAALAVAEPDADPASTDLSSPVPDPVIVNEFPVRIAELTQPSDGGGTLERIMQAQLNALNTLIEGQLRVLRDGSPVAAPVPAAAPSDASATDEVASTEMPFRTTTPGLATVTTSVENTSADGDSHSMGPYTPGTQRSADELSAQQASFLRDFMERYSAKTAGSKRITEETRPYLADPRVVASFRQQWKEIVYPIVTDRSLGSHLWDVDGNEYVDLVCGFGPIAFGHRPDFIVKAMQHQLATGYEIGPQTPLAGDVARLVCELTGAERVTFCNTGSEATMAALRVARTVTGRQKVVTFAGSYHGTYDEVLVKRVGKEDASRTLPIAPGIPVDNVQNMVVLEYGTTESLQWIRDHVQELAAVMVEPVQSRHPRLQPKEFLQQLRVITSQGTCALILDEVITGFRTHPGGMQALWDIQADLVTYGKVLAGGMPIGALAGKAAYMDALDGGMWQYGDDSFPEVGVTFFAGTFVRHPLALAAAKAVLEHLKEEGPALQERLSARTAGLVARLNELLSASGMPTRIETFASLFYFSFPSHFRFGTLLYYFLRERGIHIQEGFPCFLSTAHSDADIELIYNAFASAAASMHRGGFLGESGSLAQSNTGAGMPISASFDRSDSHASVAPASSFPALASPTALSTVPVTDAQLEIWLSTQLDPAASCAYNEAFTVRLGGELGVAALRAALTQVIARHDALRATFSADGSSMYFLASMEIDVPLIDVSSDVDMQESMRRILEHDATVPFDLVQGPLVRTQLLRLSSQEHVLLFTAHHIVCDGWSANVIVEELGTLYSELRAGRDPELGVAASFASYALAQTQTTAIASQAAAEAYWLRQFADLPPSLDLPLDRARPTLRRFEGATVQHRIPLDLQHAVRRTGAKYGATLFTTLLAALDVLLFRLTGQQDVVVGIPAAAQSALDAHDLVGHCVNFLLVRAHSSGDESLADFLARSQTTLLDAYEHQNYTYGTLIRRLPVQRDPSRPTLVEVQFNLEKLGGAARFDGLEILIEPGPKARVTFDLFLNVVDTPQGLVINCDYNADLFDETTILRWLRHYHSLLSAIADDSGQNIAALPLLDADEIHHIVEVWNDTAREVPSSTIHELFEAQVRRTPHAMAATCGGKRMTYRELNCRANQIAHRLRAFGVGPDVVVGLCVERSLDMLAAVLGVLKAGGAYVPLDPTYPPERLSFMLDDVAAPVLITTNSLLRQFQFSCQVLCLDTADLGAIESGDNLPLVAQPRNLAYVIYTSGSTGRPKGVAIEHHSVVAFLHWVHQVFMPAELSGVLASTSICFDLSIFEMLAPLTCGGALIVVNDLLQLPGIPETDRVTLINTVPSVMAELLRHYRLPPSLLTVNLAGEALPQTLVGDIYRDGADRRVYNLYGPTEDTTYSTAMLVAKNGAGPPTVGYPIANTQVYVLDTALMPVPIGVTGELHLAGDGLARGYLNREELTREKFVENPFSPDPQARMYRTGDLARFRPDGQIEYLGRKDYQVKIHGHRIELGEIESALQQHPVVQAAAVVASEGEFGDTRIRAFVTCRPALHLPVPEARAQIQADLRAWLPTYMIPSSLDVLDTMPLTSNGKIDRMALSTLSGTAFDSQQHAGPSTLLHHQLIQMWADLLHVHPVGIHDDFFQLGGNSLLAVQLVRQIEWTTGKKVSLSTLLVNPTIDGLANVVRRQQEGGSDAVLVPIQTAGSRRPLFFAHGDYEGGGMYCARLARELGPDQPFYALQPHGLCGLPVPHSIEQSAADYIALIRTVQPKGPYILGGYCDGGLVAFEMAQQLKAQGEAVADLIMIDVGSGSLRRRRGRAVIGRIGKVTGMSLDMEREFYIYLRRHRNSQREKSGSEKVGNSDLLLRNVRRLRHRARPGTDESRVESGSAPLDEDVGGSDLLSVYWWANAGYKPNPYAGRAIMLWAEDEVDTDPGNSVWEWKEVIASFTLRHVQGSHYTCITAHVHELAQAITSRLETTQTTLCVGSELSRAGGDQRLLGTGSDLAH